MNSPVPGLARSLSALSDILRKGEAFCADHALEPQMLLEARMAATMKPLTHQIRLACNAATEAAMRLSGAETATIEGPYESFDDLYESIERARVLITSVPAEAFDGADGRIISVILDDTEVTCSAHQYLTEYATPNFYFAMTTAYNILRNRGVPLGKKDFLGGNTPLRTEPGTSAAWS